MSSDRQIGPWERRFRNGVRRLAGSRLGRGWPTIMFRTGSLGLLVVILLARAPWTEPEPIEPQALVPRWILSATITLSGAAVMLGWVGFGANTLDRVRRFLSGSATLLILLWILGTIGEITLQPRLIFDAYLISGLLLLLASWLLGHEPKTLEKWAFGMAAAIVFWLLATISALGILFDTPIGARPIHLVAGVVMWLGSTFSVYYLLREADSFDASRLVESVHLSDKTLSLVLGGLVAGYGLWYGYIVRPTDIPPTLDVSVAIEAAAELSVDPGDPSHPFAGQDRHGRYIVSFKASNTGDARVVMLGDLFNVYAADVATPDSGLDCRARTTLLARTAAFCEGLDHANRLSPGMLDGSVGANADASLVYEPFHVGTVWSNGEWLEPGASIERRLVVPGPTDVHHIRADLVVVFARGDRLVIAPPDDYTSATASECRVQNSAFFLYRRLAGDPITGLIGAFDPGLVEVVWKPDVANVPKVKEMTRDAAAGALRDAGVADVRFHGYDDDGSDIVLRQEPPENTTVPRGGTVTLYFDAEQLEPTPTIKPRPGTQHASDGIGEDQQHDDAEGEDREARWRIEWCRWDGQVFKPSEQELGLGAGGRTTNLGGESAIAYIVASDEFVAGAGE